MLDISSQGVEVSCPDCHTTNTITLQQVADEATIKCSECKKDIKLTDQNGSAKESISSINKALKGLDDSFGRLGS